ncbi:hypothetical protein PVAP13_1KG474505 [Panicum virgatum]|uniref:Uncharacterized protein n=1 Tax=Panicum virgatum TaxID=38727 RepID=A0A8T0XPI1_PANVG|nr:hypothetical protein PVAP13_1KG474505 [Panicum virgatum]
MLAPPLRGDGVEGDGPYRRSRGGHTCWAGAAVVPRRGKKESNNNDRVPKNKLLFPSAEGIGASSGQVKGMVLVSVDTSLSEQVVAEYIPAENAAPSEGRTVTAWPAFVMRSGARSR